MDSNRTALILIGYQNDYFSPEGKLYSAIEEGYQAATVLGNTVRLLERISHTPVLIVSTPIVFTEACEELENAVGVLATIKEVGAFRIGTPGAETVPEFDRLRGRIVEVPGKRGLNAFSDTTLDEVLRAHRIEHVVIAGVVTSICVDTTGRAAAERGYRVTVLDDCTCGRSAFEQEFYCQKIFPIYAEVCGHERLLEALHVEERSTVTEAPEHEVVFQVHQRLFEELSQTQRRYRALVDNLRNIVFQYDLDGHITFVNPAWRQLLGYGKEETLGKPLSRFVVDPFPDREWVDRHFHDAPFQELKLRHADGREMWFELSVRGVENGGVGLLYDIGEQKAQALRLQEAMEVTSAATEAKSRFLAVMSHEIRTPMNGVIGMADLLGRTDLDDRQRRFVTTLRNSGEAMLALVDELLDFSKIEAGRLTLERHPVDLAETVGEAVALMAVKAGEKGLALETEIDPALPPRLLGDAGRLRQVLLNLIGNAVKFTDQGSVRVTVSDVPEERIAFAVTDTGIGIPADAFGNLFEPFTQVDGSTCRGYGGTGLGLAICSRLVERMGGTIEVESRLGEGSTFRVTLPVEPASEGGVDLPIAKFANEDESSPRPLEVLLVEDDPASREVIGDLLEELGHTARIATGGAEALSWLAGERFDLVLMDIHLPEMDGIEVTRRIQRTPPSHGVPPVIALTADALPETQEACRAAGMAGFLTKPIDAAGLRRGLSGVVH